MLAVRDARSGTRHLGDLAWDSAIDGSYAGFGAEKGGKIFFLLLW